MIGAGLYVSSAYAINDLRDARLVVAVWAIGGVLAMCGAVAYGGLVERLPHSGGEYLFLSRLYSPSFGWIAGFISLLAGFTLPITVSALVVGNYLAPSDLSEGFTPQLIAMICIALAAALHMLSVRVGSAAQNIVVALKLAILFAFVGITMVVASNRGWYSGLMPVPLSSDSGTESILSVNVWAEMMKALYFVSLSYTGYNAAVYLAGAFPKGDKRLRQSMVLAVALVSLVYCSTNAVCLFAVPAEDIAMNEQFFATVADSVGGSTLEWIVRLAIAISSATSVFAMLLTGPFVYRQMRHDLQGYRENQVGSEEDTSQASPPRTEILVQAGLCMLLVNIISLKSLIETLGLTLTCCAAVAVAGLWRISRLPIESKPLRRHEHIAAGIFVAGSLLMIVTAYFISPESFFTAVAILAIAIGLQWIVRTARPRKANP
jgi:APA family basic amino acid/polyamine antiporter